MYQERRNGASPIPTDPEFYITEQQVQGLIILKKFGWKLVCIRRCHDLYPSVILKNKSEGRVGVLEYNGVLKLSEGVCVRSKTRKDAEVSDEMTNNLLAKFGRYSSTGSSKVEWLSINK
jgi:hypothetical protein